MLDTALRPLKENIFTPLCHLVPGYITPTYLTFTAFISGLISCYYATTSQSNLSVLFWFLNRIFDCLDGGVARLRNQSSDLGGFLDLLGDFIVYSLIPISCASSVTAQERRQQQRLWMSVAFVEMSFHINNFVLFYVAAIAEKWKAIDVRNSQKGKDKMGESVKRLTSVMMKPAMIEGFESGVIFTVMLAMPQWTEILCWAMTVLVVIGICQRVVWVSSVMH